MSARAFIVFAWGILIVRLGERRLLGRNAGFDMLLIVILGSVLSRAVNGQSSFFPTLGVSAVLVLFHYFVSVLTFRSDFLSRWIKGRAHPLVKNGKLDEKELRDARITYDDLLENLRLNGNVAGTKDVAEAVLERDGSVSVVRKLEE